MDHSGLTTEGTTGLRIEDYALIGDTETAGLVGIDGSLDWLCLPRFDSAACCAALLGDEGNGRWLIAPATTVRTTRRRYRGDSLVLETEFESDRGVVRLVDCMPPREEHPAVVRVVEGVSGRVPMRMQLVIRFDYGRTVPWVRRLDGRTSAIAGPDALVLDTDITLEGEGLTTVADFSIGAGETAAFVLGWHPSNEAAPPPIDPTAAIATTEAWWHQWVGPRPPTGRWSDLVTRSLLTLKALTYAPTGGIIAAPTTSLPEEIGGVRNWDYRYCWVRDATFTLYSLMLAGYTSEAQAWRDWLIRAVAGRPEDMQIMYGAGGERRLPEMELPWLGGYEGSRPVRIGNAAVEQFQLDVYGEVMDALHQAARAGIATDEHAWEVQRLMMEFLESAWTLPDEGIWEVRGPRRHFTHSKVMAWVAADRAVKTVEQFRLDGPASQWRRLRDEIHADVCRSAWDDERQTFTQYYGSHELDAAVLMIPMVGFLPPSDPRVHSTVAAVERFLGEDGFIRRYTQGSEVDGLPGGEGVFLACTFWLADNYALLGRHVDAERVFTRLAGLANDVGLLSEQYDTGRKRMLGNFPQAFTHVSLINTAANLSSSAGPVHHRRSGIGASPHDRG